VVKLYRRLRHNIGSAHTSDAEIFPYNTAIVPKGNFLKLPSILRWKMRDKEYLILKDF
jgi:hypothetical protein